MKKISQWPHLSCMFRTKGKTKPTPQVLRQTRASDRRVRFCDLQKIGWTHKRYGRSKHTHFTGYTLARTDMSSVWSIRTHFSAAVLFTCFLFCARGTSGKTWDCIILLPNLVQSNVEKLNLKSKWLVVKHPIQSSQKQNAGAVKTPYKR